MSIYTTAKRYFSIAIIKLIGWRIEGELPAKVNKVVLLGVPHTSSIDFVMMLLSAWYYRLNVKWVGKENLFKPKLLGMLSTLMGGIRVERNTANNSVAKIASVLNNCSGSLCLVIAPNGSRKNINGWRSGFYHIAQAANLPLALGFLDYGKKRMGIKHTLTPTGNIENDLEYINTFYLGVTGRHADIRCPIKLIP